MAAELERLTKIEIRLALEDLNTDFCNYLDHGDIDALLDLFTPDAIYTHGPRRSSGREEIRDLFEYRSNTGVRTARHLYSALKLDILNGEQATGSSVCMTFAEDDAPPVNHASPYLVADFIDEYRYCEDGRWRICKRHIERIFTAPGNQAPVGYTSTENDSQ